MMLEIGVDLELPELLDAPDRVVNRAGKESMRDVLWYHHRKITPLHFQASARARYGYRERSKGWKRKKMKLYGSRTDLVATGRLKAVMTRVYRGSVGGTMRTELKGTSIKRFPWGMRSKANDKGVTITVMKQEIERTIPAEEREFADRFGRGLHDRMTTYQASRRRTYRRRT